MSISKKHLVCLTFCVALALSATAHAARQAAAQAEPPASDAQIVHLLNRISFGPMPGDVENVRRMGISDYIELQLRPDAIPHTPELDEKLSHLSTLTASMADLVNAYQMQPKVEKTLPEEQRKEVEKRKNIVLQELSQAKILRAIMSPAQLQEVMVDFWYNHFNVFAEKGYDKLFVSSYERDAIRPFALGRFRDLLGATAHHPAMLFYLDNWTNTDPNSMLARKKKLGINENYAREVMELHTLGVDGGYTQEDVTTLAHILTGWGLGEGQGPVGNAYFYFEPRRHDFSDQIWFNNSIRGGGTDEIEHVLDLLAKSPATAHHISYELAQYFVADEPPASLVTKLTSTFLSSDGDIAVVLRQLFYSPEFWDTHYAQTKFKPPFRFIISSFRAGNAVPPGDTRGLQGLLAQEGEPLYRCLTPNGYANTNDQWLNSDALLKRIDFAKLISGYLGDHATDTILSSLGRTWTPNTIKTAEGVEPKLQPALLMSSPEFLYY